MSHPTHHPDEENALIPSDFDQLAPFAEELRRLAYDIDYVIRKRASLPRCLSGITAMRPLMNLIEESAIKLLSGVKSDGDFSRDLSDPEIEQTQDTRRLTPGYL